MQRLLHEDEDVIAKIHALMTKLKTLILAARLMKLSQLRAKTRNVTRWSSTYEMLLRYNRLKDFLPKLNSSDIDSLCLSSSENRRVDTLLTNLKELESVTKILQAESTKLSDVRGLFDAVIDSYPETTSKLTSFASIVHSPVFKAAVVKLQLCNQGALSREERAVVKNFELQRELPVEDGREDLSFAQRALKRQKVNADDFGTKYMDLRFLIPTSNVCERFFQSLVTSLLSGVRNSTRSTFRRKCFSTLTETYGVYSTQIK